MVKRGNISDSLDLTSAERALVKRRGVHDAAYSMWFLRIKNKGLCLHCHFLTVVVEHAYAPARVVRSFTLI